MKDSDFDTKVEKILKIKNTLDLMKSSNDADFLFGLISIIITNF